MILLRTAAPAMLAVAFLEAGLAVSEGSPVPGEPLALVPISNVTDDDARVLNGTVAVEAFTVDGRIYLAAASAHDDGVQIIEVTDPAGPAVVSGVRSGPAALLDGAYDIAAFGAGGSTYLAVAAVTDDAVQIINVTDPARPVPVSHLSDDAGTALDGASAVAAFGSGNRTYLAVASYREGVQVIDVTDPSRPVPAASVFDDDTLMLGGARGLAFFGVGHSAYLAVAAPFEDAIQVINVTDPPRPAPVSGLDDGHPDASLGGARHTIAFHVDGSTYLAVAARSGNATQIINVTDPARPVPVGSVADGPSTLLAGAAAVAAGSFGDFAYLLAVSMFEEGVQAIDVTDPARPVPVGAPGGGPPAREGTIRDVTIFGGMDGRTYAAVAAGFFDGRVELLEVVPDGSLLARTGAAPTVPVSAAYLPGPGEGSGGRLEVAFSGPLNGTVRADLLGIRDAEDAGRPGLPALPGAALRPNATGTLTAPLDPARAAALLNMTSPVLDVGYGAVFGELGNPAPGTAGYPISVPDMVPPALLSASYDTLAYTLDISFSEPLNHTATDYPGLALLGSSGNLTLAEAANRTARDHTITATLNATQAGAVGAALAFAVEGGSAADTAGNHIRAASVPVTTTGNRTMVADAGPDQAAFPGDTVTLHGSGSGPGGDPPAYLWRQTAGDPVALSNHTVPSPTFIAPAAPANHTLTFELTVSAGALSASDSASVIVAAPPSREITGLSLSSDTPGAIQVTWDGLEGNIRDYRVSWAKVGDSYLTWTDHTGNAFPTGSSHTITDLEEGAEYKVIVRARYQGGPPGPWSGELTVTVAAAPANRPPVADAGPDQNDISEGQTVTLDGSSSADPDPGDAITYLWTQTSGTAVTLSNHTVSSPTFAAPAGPDTLIFQLAVTDRHGASATDTVAVQVAAANNPPAADAGSDQDGISEGQTVTLDGSSSADPDPGDAITYLWTQTSGTAVTLSNHTVSSPTFAAPAGPDTLIFQLAVTDRHGASATDTVAVQVAAANNPPVAEAGADLAVQEEAAATLNGSGTDPDEGDTLTYLWTQSPATPAIQLDDPASPTPSFTAPAVDADTAITMTLSVTDQHGASSSDTVTVTVTAAEPPSREITGLSLSSDTPGAIQVTWDGLEGNIRDYRVSWAKVGDSYTTWTDHTGNAFPTGPSHDITDLEEGAEYKVIVRARYQGGPPGPWSGELTVTVAAAPANRPPVTENGAGLDPTITVPPRTAVTLGSTYADPGATRTGPGDGDLPVMVSTHQLDTTVLGEQWVFYGCKDGAGNGANAGRMVTVVEP